MGLTNPTVIIYCDFCEDSIEDELSLTALGRNSFDKRHIKKQAEELGWVFLNDKHLCPSCIDGG